MATPAEWYQVLVLDDAERKGKGSDKTTLGKQESSPLH
jgi:hypothetical protein